MKFAYSQCMCCAIVPSSLAILNEVLQGKGGGNKYIVVPKSALGNSYVHTTELSVKSEL